MKEGQLVGRRIYPAQLGVALMVAGEGEYRTYHLSRVEREGEVQWREVQLDLVSESPVTRFEFLLALTTIFIGAGLLIGWLAWKLGKMIVADRVAPVVATVLLTFPLMLYMTWIVFLAL